MITRFEIIDFTDNPEDGSFRKVIVPQDSGKVIEYILQDEGKTLKVFIGRPDGDE